MEQKNNCKNCKKRHLACQDTCPDKSTGTFYKDPEAEYLSYKRELFFYGKPKRVRRKH